MPQKRFTSEEIIELLRRAEIELSKGKTVSQASSLPSRCRQSHRRAQLRVILKFAAVTTSRQQSWQSWLVPDT